MLPVDAVEAKDVDVTSFTLLDGDGCRTEPNRKYPVVKILCAVKEIACFEQIQ